MLSSQVHPTAMITKWQANPSEHSKKSVFLCHLSSERAHTLEMWPIPLAEPNQSVVENTKNGSLLTPGGKIYKTPPKPKQNKTKQKQPSPS